MNIIYWDGKCGVVVDLEEVRATLLMVVLACNFEVCGVNWLNEKSQRSEAELTWESLSLSLSFELAGWWGLDQVMCL